MHIDKSKLKNNWISVDGNHFPYNVGEDSITVMNDLFSHEYEDSSHLYKYVFSKVQAPPCRRYYFTYNQDNKETGIFSQSYSNALVTAMVRSGDFTVMEAILVVTDCCERCLNALEVKYLHPEDRVACDDYFYDQWVKKCAFCDPDDDKYFCRREKGEETEATNFCNCCTEDKAQ